MNARAASTPQSGILNEGFRSQWVQQYRLRAGAGDADLRFALARLGRLHEDDVAADRVVLAVRPSIAERLFPGQVPAGGHDFAEVTGPQHSAPSTQDDLFVWFQSTAPEENLLGALHARRHLEAVADLHEETPGFVVRNSLDLTGFEDGTENPDLDEAPEVAFVPAATPGAGCSFVFAQRWHHDLRAFSTLDGPAQERVIGRTKDGSLELDPLPERSHVERVVVADDEGDEREIYRRSFPCGTTDSAGLFFLAFSNDPTLVEVMLARMFGLDGPADRLVEFSRPLTGSFYIAPTAEMLASLTA